MKNTRKLTNKWKAQIILFRLHHLWIFNVTPTSAIRGRKMNIRFQCFVFDSLFSFFALHPFSAVNHFNQIWADSRWLWRSFVNKSVLILDDCDRENCTIHPDPSSLSQRWWTLCHSICTKLENSFSTWLVETMNGKLYLVVIKSYVNESYVALCDPWAWIIGRQFIIGMGSPRGQLG